MEHRANLDQLLAIHNAVKYPVTYVQGPPGTGKSHTIINSIITAFFNEKTVLLASYNNHPIDTVVEKLRSIPYKQGEDIPFPVIRLGNTNLVKQALLDIREQYERIKDKPVFEGTLEKNKDNKINRARKLTELLKKYENTLALREKQEAIECLLGSTQHLTFQTRQLGRDTSSDPLSWCPLRTKEGARRRGTLSVYKYPKENRRHHRFAQNNSRRPSSIILCKWTS